MDSALVLRMKVDQNKEISDSFDYLDHSDIIKNYAKMTKLKPLGKIFALIGLAEIPYAEKLPITQELLAFVNQNLSTSEGFSFTGKLEEIVPCYNAMLFEAYCRLGLGKSSEAQNALQWIKQYQVFDRQQKTTWPHKGICKFGGCMMRVPCYIGIGKTMRALLTYQEKVDPHDEKVNALIEQGVDYMLQHNLYQRLSTGHPISPHITESMFPQSYVLSLTDLMYIIEKSQYTTDPRAHDLLQLIHQKKTKTGGWKIDYIYKYAGYLPFENRRKDSEWITYLYSPIE
ncbi:hypothetical protein PMV48_20475 [Enterococcus avium]|jgi:hypothetical protein|nr:hypothetical protein [Enterococcus avium]MDB1726139.1 hypothetical protein [Enterococcus avium]MDU2215921.1 hypothetical protein [Enterococcus avium]MDU6622309.1 hypothetical protein [Enterococcus avium]MZJ60072.1 hypothetical protein [Enterococcus avium]MZJ80608.1 hypothetical protein [Enterococcus avium]